MADRGSAEAGSRNMQEEFVKALPLILIMVHAASISVSVCVLNVESSSAGSAADTLHSRLLVSRNDSLAVSRCFSLSLSAVSCLQDGCHRPISSPMSSSSWLDPGSS